MISSSTQQSHIPRNSLLRNVFYLGLVFAVALSIPHRVQFQRIVRNSLYDDVRIFKSLNEGLGPYAALIQVEAMRDYMDTDAIRTASQSLQSRLALQECTVALDDLSIQYLSLVRKQSESIQVASTARDEVRYGDESLNLTSAGTYDLVVNLYSYADLYWRLSEDVEAAACACDLILSRGVRLPIRQGQEKTKGVHYMVLKEDSRLTVSENLRAMRKELKNISKRLHKGMLEFEFEDTEEEEFLRAINEMAERTIVFAPSKFDLQRI